MCSAIDDAQSLLPHIPIDSNGYSLGIMGGTFDPIHYGHLVTAQQAMGDLNLDGVLFMPTGLPAFKQDRDVTPGEDRYSMVLLATASNPHFFVSRLEIARPGITYTVDTLRFMRQHYSENIDLYFITGADAISEIVSWHDAASISQLAKFVAATRPGYDLEFARKAIANSPYDFDVTYLEVPALPISSSYLRQRQHDGQSLRYLTPESVIGYIEKHNLYSSSEAAAS